MGLAFQIGEGRNIRIKKAATAQKRVRVWYSLERKVLAPLRINWPTSAIRVLEDGCAVTHW